MGKLYDVSLAIQKAIDSSGQDPIKTRGSIGLKSGVLLTMVKPDTPDDPGKIEKLKIAAKEILGVSV